MLNADDPLVPVSARVEHYVHQALMEQPGADVFDLISRFHTEFAVRMRGSIRSGNRFRLRTLTCSTTSLALGT